MLRAAVCLFVWANGLLGCVVADRFCVAVNACCMGGAFVSGICTHIRGPAAHADAYLASLAQAVLQ